jgi:hypothetical protein
MDVFKPRGAQQPRNPTTDQQNNGRVINTPRYDRMGGLDSPKKIGAKNSLTIKPPGDGAKVI